MKKISIQQIISQMNTTVGNLQIKTFRFNPIRVNTYVFYDDSKEAVIVDPGNVNHKESEKLLKFIEEEGLQVKYILNTHPHIDHVAGNSFCKKNFDCQLVAHEEGMPIYSQSKEYGANFGFTETEYPLPDYFVKDNDEIAFGHQRWKVIYTPGHADGSICFYDHEHKLVIVGDVLFEGGIGRTDLPTGDYNLLINNIRQKLLTLEDDVVVYCGHDVTTTIGEEKKNNPYL